MNMSKNIEKEDLSITTIILIAFVSIMILSAFIIGAIIFRNWLAYADKSFSDTISRFDNDVYNVVEFYIENHFHQIEETDILDNHLEMLTKDTDSMAIVIDRNSGKLIGNSVNMDNYLIFQDGRKKEVRINDMGYPALTEAYKSYLDTNVTSYKLSNIQTMLYINISEYRTEYFDWLIFTVMPDTQFTAAVKEGIISTINFSVITLTVTVVAYLFLAKKLLKPASHLLEITKKFGDGDFSQRAVVVRNDEIGMIAKSFNKMADTINELFENLEEKVADRTLELKVANDLVNNNRNQLRLILDSTAEGIFGLDVVANCTFCNASGLELLGYNHEDELIGMNMHYQIHHSRKDTSPLDITECRIVKAIKDGAHFYADDEVFWRKDGTSFDVEYHVLPQLQGDEIIGAVVSFKDITESKKAQKQIEYLSSHDPVTGLYNRRIFDNQLKSIDVEKNLPISIIYGDVNGLKLINDIYGHEKGDELLIKTAKVLKNACRDSDIIARVGGDEFVILLPNTKAKEAKQITQRIKDDFSAEDIGGIRGSISLASDTKITLGQDIQIILKNAEAEMYKIKSIERKSINSKIFDDVMSSLYEKSQREELHSSNVAGICGKIAINMGLPETEVKRVKTAGFYHDIGKIVLDKEVLNKTSKLNAQEKEKVELHSLIGYRILNLFEETVDIADIVLSHHEKWNGKGYPKGLRGEEIPLFARIISVAEAYDSMTNKLGGKGISHEEALERIKALSGIDYDPIVVENFLHVF